ncbi:unnamed protein product [Mytilus coruscus]|uniref:Reverse transcriptase zinc-binding domain-containing protein n=1 Tax=Mytilus coruscus TaxID=42192 RepID=A0A6J8ES65_MYTCO|nr:unnamed protein product [Mytilus coruscus]
MLENIVEEPVGIELWKSEFDVSSEAFSKIWEHVNMYWKPSNLVELDFKVLHNCIFTNVKLQKIGLVDDNICKVCCSEKEDILHIFMNCDKLEDFHNYLSSLLVRIFENCDSDKISLVRSEELLILGLRWHMKVKIEFSQRNGSRGAGNGYNQKQNYVRDVKSYQRDCTVRIERINTDVIGERIVIEDIETITGLNSVLAVVKNDAMSYDITLDSKQTAFNLVQEGIDIANNEYQVSMLHSDITVVSIMKLQSFISDEDIRSKLVSKGVKIVSPIYRRAISGTQDCRKYPCVCTCDTCTEKLHRCTCNKQNDANDPEIVKITGENDDEDISDVWSEKDVGDADPIATVPIEVNVVQNKQKSHLQEENRKRKMDSDTESNNEITDDEILNLDNEEGASNDAPPGDNIVTGESDNEIEFEQCCSDDESTFVGDEEVSMEGANENESSFCSDGENDTPNKFISAKMARKIKKKTEET